MLQQIPASFWTTMAITGMVIFVVFGLDLLLGAKLVHMAGRVVNKKFEMDQLIVKALRQLKQISDREYDLDRALLNGWGRFVVSGLLFFGAALILVNLLPLIH